MQLIGNLYKNVKLFNHVLVLAIIMIIMMAQREKINKALRRRQHSRVILLL